MIQLARDARLYPGEGWIDFEKIIELCPPLNFSIELPNQSRISELGFEEHARRSLLHAKKTFGNSKFNPGKLCSNKVYKLPLRERYVPQVLTKEENKLAYELIRKARVAMTEIENWDKNS